MRPYVPDCKTHVNYSSVAQERCEEFCCFYLVLLGLIALLCHVINLDTWFETKAAYHACACYSVNTGFPLMITYGNTAVRNLIYEQISYKYTQSSTNIWEKQNCF